MRKNELIPFAGLPSIWVSRFLSHSIIFGAVNWMKWNGFFPALLAEAANCIHLFGLHAAIEKNVIEFIYLPAIRCPNVCMDALVRVITLQCCHVERLHSLFEINFAKKTLQKNRMANGMRSKQFGFCLIWFRRRYSCRSESDRIDVRQFSGRENRLRVKKKVEKSASELIKFMLIKLNRFVFLVLLRLFPPNQWIFSLRPQSKCFPVRAIEVCACTFRCAIGTFLWFQLLFTERKQLIVI